jgi:hypothetical protein
LLLKTPQPILFDQERWLATTTDKQIDGVSHRFEGNIAPRLEIVIVHCFAGLPKATSPPSGMSFDLLHGLALARVAPLEESDKD